MPGRQDFGVVRARLMSDPRAHAAANLYVAAKIAHRKTALAAVLGHISMLGVWACRETDDGVLTGDGALIVQIATMTDDRTARSVLGALMEVGLIKVDRKSGSPRLAGFSECYDPILYQRERNRRNAAAKRAKDADVPPNVSGDVPADVSGDVSGLRYGTVRDGTLSPARPREGSPEGERDSPGVPPPANGHDLAERIFRPATVEDWDAMWSAVSQWAKIESRDTASAHYDLARRIVAANSKRSLRKPPSADQPLPWHDQPALTRNRDWIESIDPGALLRIARKGGAA